MEDNKYVYKCRSKYDSTIDQYIYWAHPKSIKLFNTFSTVLIIDSTHKTNVYWMSLFKVVRVTSFEKAYSVGFAFMTFEKYENFTWVQQMLLDLLNYACNIQRWLWQTRISHWWMMSPLFSLKLPHYFVNFISLKMLKLSAWDTAKPNIRMSKKSKVYTKWCFDQSICISMGVSWFPISIYTNIIKNCHPLKKKSNSSPTSVPRSIPRLNGMFLFMRPYIEKIVDTLGNGNLIMSCN